MFFAAVDVTLRVGGAGRVGDPTHHPDVARGGLPFTGASIVTFLAAAFAMVVLGTIFLLHGRREEP